MKKIVAPFPYRLFNPSADKASITIVFYHGWGSSADNYIEFADFLAGQGYRVIVPEIKYHDSRMKLDHHFETKIMQEFFWKTVFETIQESQELFKAVGLDKKKTVIAGSSMGGFIANGIFADHPQLAGLVNINGSGSFVRSEEIFRKMDGRPELSSKEIEWLKEYNPIEKKPGLSPVLLMHGEQDTTIPIDGQKHYDHYLTIENNKKNAVFKTYRDVNHTISDEMIHDFIGWLNENFKDK